LAESHVHPRCLPRAAVSVVLGNRWMVLRQYAGRDRIYIYPAMEKRIRDDGWVFLNSPSLRLPRGPDVALEARLHPRSYSSFCTAQATSYCLFQQPSSDLGISFVVRSHYTAA
jgi:hypothetical protein